MIKLYLFDMDKTLLESDCDVTWKEFLVKHHLAPENALETAEKFNQDYKAGTLDDAAFTEFQLAEFKGKTKPEMLKLAVMHFEEYVKPNIRPQAFSLVKELISKGMKVAMLTSTNHILATPVAAHFGITDYIGAGLEMVNGRFTGRPAGCYPDGNGKIFHLGRLCERFAIDAAEVAAFGDSVNDIRLLETVGLPVAISPSPALRERAASGNWKIEEWHI